jgi:hypothetical protein
VSSPSTPFEYSAGRCRCAASTGALAARNANLTAEISALAAAHTALVAENAQLVVENARLVALCGQRECSDTPPRVLLVSL